LLIFRSQDAWNNIYPLFIATSTSPQCILDHHRSIAAHINYKGILKIEGALTLDSKANSVNHWPGANHAAGLPGGRGGWMCQRRQHRPPSLPCRQSRRRHRGPSGDEINKMVSVWTSAPFGRCDSAAFTLASRLLQQLGTNLVNMSCTLMYQYVLYFKRSHTGIYQYVLEWKIPSWDMPECMYRYEI
jgi:hypothetical protein